MKQFESIESEAKLKENDEETPKHSEISEPSPSSKPQEVSDDQLASNPNENA